MIAPAAPVAEMGGAAAPRAARALLAPQPAPDCTFPANESPADERQKLDYERQCYRHAEIIVRDRLHRLQTWVSTNVQPN